MSAALQTAVITTLRAALGIPVYDEVPQGAALPYVVLDTTMTVPEDGLSTEHERVTLYLTLWRKDTSALGIEADLTAIKTALHNRKLPMTSGTNAITRLVRSSTDRDIDRRVRIGRATYEALTTS
jgi:hypothetical protein